MLEWQHGIARLLLGGLAFLLAGVGAALASWIVWQVRWRLSLKCLKEALSLLGVAPIVIGLAVALAPGSALCEIGKACYLTQLQRHFGDGAAEALRMALVVVGVLYALFLIRLFRLAVHVALTLRRMYLLSSPPSEKLRQTLRQVVPPWAQGRFRELPFARQHSGVYGGTCFLSTDSVQQLESHQLAAVVAHEWQHLRMHDGWYALVVGLLAEAAALSGWRQTLQRWRRCAEWLADAQTVAQGIPRTTLAFTLLQHCADSSAQSVGSAGMASNVEERLMLLLSAPSVCGRRRVCYSFAVGAGLLLLYVIWAQAEASICTVHCALFW